MADIDIFQPLDRLNEIKYKYATVVNVFDKSDFYPDPEHRRISTSSINIKNTIKRSQSKDINLQTKISHSRHISKQKSDRVFPEALRRTPKYFEWRAIECSALGTICRKMTREKQSFVTNHHRTVYYVLKAIAIDFENEHVIKIFWKVNY